MNRILPLLVCMAIVFGGCAEPIKSVVIRSDGQSMADNPVLRHAYTTDELVCIGEMQKASLSGVTVTGGGGLANYIAQSDRNSAANAVLRGCLAQRGYVIVREDEAAAKTAEYRALAEAAARQQQASSRSPVVTGSIAR
jgi:hypothetical protein